MSITIVESYILTVNPKNPRWADSFRNILANEYPEIEYQINEAENTVTFSGECDPIWGVMVSLRKAEKETQVYSLATKPLPGTENQCLCEYSEPQYLASCSCSIM